MPFSYISLFAGIEAASVAWAPLGWKAIAFAEVDPFASAVLSHHYPAVPNVGDVTKHEWSQYRGSVDLVVGGPPCQAFSVAGLRRSLDDDRGNLSLEYVRAVHAINPVCCVTENVPGWLSTKDNAFGCFLAGLVGEGEPLVCRGNSWPNAGMAVGPRRSAAWRVLDAQYFGLAQRRRRVFVVSFRTGDGINPGAVLFEPESLPRHSPPSRQAGARVAASLTRGADSSGKGGYAGRRQEDDVNIVNCLDRHMGSGGPDDNAAQAEHLVPDVVGTLSDGAHMGGGLTGKTPIVDELSRCLNAGGMGRQDFETETLIPVIGGFFSQPNHTLRADGFDASEDGTGQGTPIVPAAIQAGMAVRRLTPRECERLQGFPDDYTLIPYRGRPAADGPRYRALGNSMAVPVMRWIGERIVKVLEARKAGAA